MVAHYWQQELAAALSEPALAAFDDEAPVPEAAAEAALRVALCLGYCRLFHVELPEELDGVLPAREALAAAKVLKDRIRSLTHDARDLPGRCYSAPDGLAQEYCADLLQARMDAWACFEAIAEAHEDCGGLGDEVAQLKDELSRLDDNLRDPEVVAWLSTVAGSHLLANWRGMLAGKRLPWWLDGSLEEEAARIEVESEAVFSEIQRLKTRR